MHVDASAFRLVPLSKTSSATLTNGYLPRHHLPLDYIYLLPILSHSQNFIRRTTSVATATHARIYLSSFARRHFISRQVMIHSNIYTI
jgi:hypothetical protein